MRALQPLLQRGLKSLDPWLDAVFPIATALICAKQRLAGYSLLAIYLFLRLLQRSDQEPWRWILISLLVVNAGIIIEDRDLKPGGPSDYLIVALSFAAGLQRSREQWITSLTWMASCILPLLTFSLLAGDGMIHENASFTGFNINKIGFLAGLLTVLAYGLYRQAKHRYTRLGAAALLIAGIGEIFLSESRSALAVPIIAISLDQLSTIRWTPKRAILIFLICGTIAATTIQSWYGNFKLEGNTLGDINRIETVRCWTDVTLKAKSGLAFGLGFNKTAQALCGPDRIPSLATMDKITGLGHAHNLYAQIFSETGIPGLILIVGLTATAFRKSWQQKVTTIQIFTFPLVTYLFLMALGLTFWQVMMINQVLVGYSLAALTAVDPDPCVADATIPETQPTASAPQG